MGCFHGNFLPVCPCKSIPKNLPLDCTVSEWKKIIWYQHDLSGTKQEISCHGPKIPHASTIPQLMARAARGLEKLCSAVLVIHCCPGAWVLFLSKYNISFSALLLGYQSTRPWTNIWSQRVHSGRAGVGLPVSQHWFEDYLAESSWL